MMSRRAPTRTFSPAFIASFICAAIMSRIGIVSAMRLLLDRRRPNLTRGPDGA